MYFSYAVWLVSRMNLFLHNNIYLLIIVVPFEVVILGLHTIRQLIVPPFEALGKGIVWNLACASCSFTWNILIYLISFPLKPSWGLGKEVTWQWIWWTEGLWNNSHFVFSQKFLHRKSRVGGVDYKFCGNPTPVQIVLQNAVNLSIWNTQHITTVTVRHQFG
jgi:hypothetical protein